MVQWSVCLSVAMTTSQGNGLKLAPRSDYSLLMVVGREANAEPVCV